MDSTLLDDLTAKPQREIAGSDSSLRFDYQKDWAFSRMLDFHISGQDYLVAFEFHDDVVFLDSELTPKEVEFCQVKTQKKAEIRKLSTFLTAKTGSNSIIGKLCKNIDGICKGRSIKLILVSNMPY